jgi:signal transduction histidine kinase/ActR/RegA family two-component response regulator
VLLVGTLVLAGWALDVENLKTVAPRFSEMKANTALAFALSAVALLLLRPAPLIGSPRLLAGAAAAALVTLVGLATMYQYAFDADLRIDELVFDDPDPAPGTASPGRMGLNTAFDFALLGGALLLVATARPRAALAAQVGATAAFVVALVSTVGYLYGTELLQQGFFADVTRMSMHTALTFLVLALAVVLARPDVGFMPLVRSRRPGGVVVRRLLPLGVGATLVSGWLAQTGREQRWWGPDVGEAMLVVALAVVLAGLTLVTARSLEVADLERSRAEAEQERLEAQLQQAQRMDALGRLAGGVAHDFNNLLTVVVGFSSRLQSQLPPGDPRRATVEEIKAAGERATRLTRQLLALGRGQTFEPVVLDVNEAVRSVETMLRQLVREDIRFELRLGPDAGRVRADRGQLEQVIVNLVVNAGHAMPDGGTLTIETTHVLVGADYLLQHPAATVEPGPYVLVDVRDTGHGMDEATMSHIFEPFFTTKGADEGTGLGLATVYGIVRQSGGFVWVYSEPGQGTSFKVYFPAVAEPARVAPKAGAHATTLPAGATVLVAEDEDAVRRFIRLVLEEQELHVLEAEDGHAALALSEAAPAGSIDFLVSDTVMPGIGGSALAERVRARHGGLKTLLISGYSQTDDAERPPDSDFIAKPFAPDDLTAKLEALSQRGDQQAD